MKTGKIKIAEENKLVCDCPNCQARLEIYEKGEGNFIIEAFIEEPIEPPVEEKEISEPVKKENFFTKIVKNLKEDDGEY